MDGTNEQPTEQLLQEIRTFLGVMEQTLAEGEFMKTMYLIAIKFKELDRMLSLNNDNNNLPNDWKCTDFQVI